VEVLELLVLELLVLELGVVRVLDAVEVQKEQNLR
jgi:hypothetical protein